MAEKNSVVGIYNTHTDQSDTVEGTQNARRNIMRNAISGFTAALIMMTAITIAQAQTSGFSIRKASPTLAQTATKQAPPQSGKDPTVAEEKTSAAPVDEPEEHFRKARESFLKKDFNAAAAEIRQGEAFLKLETRDATEEAKQALIASSREVERLAQGVEKGTVTSTQELRRAFARADLALAKQHYQKAAASWSKKEIKMAGHELQAAANDVELASAWSGQKLAAATTTVIKDDRAMASKLRKENGWTADKVGEGLDALGKEIAQSSASKSRQPRHDDSPSNTVRMPMG